MEEMDRFKDNMEFTKLKTNQEGVDPDDVYSQVPYEKGFQFLWRIERQVCWFHYSLDFGGSFMVKRDWICFWFILRLEGLHLMNS